MNNELVILKEYIASVINKTNMMLMKDDVYNTIDTEQKKLLDNIQNQLKITYDTINNQDNVNDLENRFTKILSLNNILAKKEGEYPYLDITYGKIKNEDDKKKYSIQSSSLNRIYRDYVWHNFFDEITKTYATVRNSYQGKYGNNLGDNFEWFDDFIDNKLPEAKEKYLNSQYPEHDMGVIKLILSNLKDLVPTLELDTLYHEIKDKFGIEFEESNMS